MAIPVLCRCGRKLKAPDNAAGRVAKCPACGALLDVPMPTIEPDELEIELDLPEEPPQLNINTGPQPQTVRVVVSQAPPPAPPEFRLTQLWPWYYVALNVASIFAGIAGAITTLTAASIPEHNVEGLRVFQAMLSIGTAWSFIGAITVPLAIGVLLDIGTSLRRIINRLPPPPPDAALWSPKNPQ